MAQIFITGSADGLGKMIAGLLIADGHHVVLHARDSERAKVALAANPTALNVITGDLSSIKETISIAQQANALGAFDAVIHNAGIGYRAPKNNNTVDGLSPIFAINSLAPYLLTCLLNRPKRFIFTSSGVHKQGDASLKDLNWQTKSWNSFQAYADTKLQNTILAFAVAKSWTNILSNAVEPGWVATKMGGADAPDSLEDGPKTQAWLATSNDAEALVTGKYFYHKQIGVAHAAANDITVQSFFLQECERLSGIAFPLQ